MRGTLFGLRSGANSSAGSPVQTPNATPLLQQTQRLQQQQHDDRDILEPLALPPPVAPQPQPNHFSRPLNRLGLTPFRKATHSPAPTGTTPNAPSASSTPVLAPTPTPSPGPAGPVNVSYLDSLGLKLGEAVNKALILPSAAAHERASAAVKVSDGSDAVLNGKRPLPAGRGRALGAMIAAELNHASNVLKDQFLYRAIIRLLQKPLTVLNTNLTQQVTHLLLAPDFGPSVPLTSFNPTQTHALALAHFASEVLETFDLLELGVSGHVLRPIREGLETVITRVVSPFVAAFKAELSAVIVQLENETPDRLERTVPRVAPLLARATFAGEAAQSAHIQGMLATLEIGAIWASLVALANRRLPLPTTTDAPTPSGGDSLRRTVSEGKLRTQPSDGALSTSSSGSSGGESAPPDYNRLLPSYITPPDTPQVAPVKEKEKERRLSSGLSLSAFKLTTSPPASTSASPRQITPPSSKKMSLVKLPSLKPMVSAAVTRAPSPPVVVKVASPQSPVGARAPSPAPAVDEALLPTIVALHALARDAHVVQRAISRLPLPVEGGLAKGAVGEAAEELEGFVDVLDHLALEHAPVLRFLSTGRTLEVLEQLMRKTREAAMLLVLPVLLRLTLATTTHSRPPSTDTVGGWIGLADDEYRRSCLSGFRKAEECAPIVGRALLKTGRATLPGGFRMWLEQSVQEEEEDSSSDEDQQA